MHVRTGNVLKTRSLEGKIPSQVVGNVGLASRASDDSLIPVMGVAVTQASRTLSVLWAVLWDR
jgi:hypothetical protein